MKKLMLFCWTLLFIIGLLSNGSLAQDYTQWQLPEGAKMRLGKGKDQRCEVFTRWRPISSRNQYRYLGV